MKLISLIIPTYNMEEYLNRCLDSLIIKECFELVEVLVIIDGAKDRSSEIAHTYQERFPDCIHVIDKENGNYGSCINRGLKEAEGKYVKVLDADDYFNTELFCEYVKQLSCIDADFILTDYSFVYHSSDKRVPASFKLTQGKVMSVEDSVIPEFPMHALTYRLQLLRDINYTQTEGISFTDMEWIFKPMFHTKNFCYLPLNVYQYMLGREGQTVDPKARSRIMNATIKVTNSLLEKYASVDLSSLSPTMREMQCHRLFMAISGTYKNALIYASEETFNADTVNEYDANVKRYAPEMYDTVMKKKPYNRFGFYPLNHIRLWRTKQKRYSQNQIKWSDRLAFIPKLMGK